MFGTQGIFTSIGDEVREKTWTDHVIEKDAQGPDGHGVGVVLRAADPLRWGVHAGSCKQHTLNAGSCKQQTLNAGSWKRQTLNVGSWKGQTLNVGSWTRQTLNVGSWKRIL